MFGIAAHLIRPEDHDALELPVLGLLYSHRSQLMRRAATVLSLQRNPPRNDGFDFRTGKVRPSACVNLVLDPRQCRTHGSILLHCP